MGRFGVHCSIVMLLTLIGQNKKVSDRVLIDQMIMLPKGQVYTLNIYNHVINDLAVRRISKAEELPKPRFGL
jgi:hypothetical protein